MANDVSQLIIVMGCVLLFGCWSGERAPVVHDSMITIKERPVRFSSVEIYEYRKNRFLRVVPTVEDNGQGKKVINLACLTVNLDIDHQSRARGAQAPVQFGDFRVSNNPGQKDYINWQLHDLKTPIAELAIQARTLSFHYASNCTH